MLDNTRFYSLATASTGILLLISLIILILVMGQETIGRLLASPYAWVLYLGLGAILLLAAASVTAFLWIAWSHGRPAHSPIPELDRTLLTQAIFEARSEAVDQYIRLEALRGFAGVLTRLGINGMPFATIGLTLVFAIMALYNQTFLDLSKLTLGAFIGSFVQGDPNTRRVRPGGALVLRPGNSAPSTNDDNAGRSEEENRGE